MKCKIIFLSMISIFCLASDDSNLQKQVLEMSQDSRERMLQLVSYIVDQGQSRPSRERYNDYNSLYALWTFENLPGVPNQHNYPQYKQLLEELDSRGCDA